MEDLNLQFGPYHPAIVKQLADRGLAPKEPHLSGLWEGFSSAAYRLVSNGLVTEPEYYWIRKRLLSRIAANVEKLP